LVVHADDFWETTEMRHHRNCFHSFFQRSLTLSLSTETESCVVEIEQQHSTENSSSQPLCVFYWISMNRNTSTHTLISIRNSPLSESRDKISGNHEKTSSELKNQPPDTTAPCFWPSSSLTPESPLLFLFWSQIPPKRKTRSFQLLAILAKLKRENHTKPLTSKSRSLQTRGVT
jgi:hypothetical protein